MKLSLKVIYISLVLLFSSLTFSWAVKIFIHSIFTVLLYFFQALNFIAGISPPMNFLCFSKKSSVFTFLLKILSNIAKKLLRALIVQSFNFHLCLFLGNAHLKLTHWCFSVVCVKNNRKDNSILSMSTNRWLWYVQT